MVDFLDLIASFLSQWLLDAAGWYCIVSVILKNFKPVKPYMSRWDAGVMEFIPRAALLFPACVLLTFIIYFITPHTQQDQYIFMNRIFGPYWMYFWYQMLVWVVCPQLLRIKPVRNKPLLRLLTGLPLAISLEEFIRTWVSFNRSFIHGLNRLFSLSLVTEILFETAALIAIAWAYNRLITYLKT